MYRVTHQPNQRTFTVIAVEHNDFQTRQAIDPPRQRQCAVFPYHVGERTEFRPHSKSQARSKAQTYAEMSEEMSDVIPN